MGRKVDAREMTLFAMRGQGTNDLNRVNFSTIHDISWRMKTFDQHSLLEFNIKNNPEYEAYIIERLQVVSVGNIKFIRAVLESEYENEDGSETELVSFPGETILKSIVDDLSMTKDATRALAKLSEEYSGRRLGQEYDTFFEVVLGSTRYEIDRMRLGYIDDLRTLQIFIVPTKKMPIAIDLTPVESVEVKDKDVLPATPQTDTFKSKWIEYSRAKCWDCQTCPFCQKMYSFEQRDKLPNENIRHEHYGNIRIYECSNCFEVFFHHKNITVIERKINLPIVKDKLMERDENYRGD